MIVVLFRSPSTPTTTKQLLHQHSLCLHEQIAAAVAAREREDFAEKGLTMSDIKSQPQQRETTTTTRRGDPVARIAEYRGVEERARAGFLTSTTGRRRRESAFVYIMHPRACISRSASMYLNEK